MSAWQGYSLGKGLVRGQGAQDEAGQATGPSPVPSWGVSSPKAARGPGEGEQVGTLGLCCPRVLPPGLAPPTRCHQGPHPTPPLSAKRLLLPQQLSCATHTSSPMRPALDTADLTSAPMVHPCPRQPSSCASPPARPPPQATAAHPEHCPHCPRPQGDSAHSFLGLPSAPSGSIGVGGSVQTQLASYSPPSVGHGVPLASVTQDTALPLPLCGPAQLRRGSPVPAW